MDSDNDLVSLLKKEFEDTDGYKSWDRVIQKTLVNDSGGINLKVYRSNQSSIHYNYKIDMSVDINDIEILIDIKLETSTSRGDPYCQRGYNTTPNEIKFTKNKNEFKNNVEIVNYIDKTFWKHYFKIESRN